MNYKKEAALILEKLGGAANVSNLASCVTRLRFTLNDKSKMDQEALEIFKDIKMIENSGGEYQLVMNHEELEHVHKELMNFLKEQAEEEEKEKKKESKNPIVRVVNMGVSTISGVFLPAIAALAASGVLRGIIALLTAVGVLTDSSSTYTVLYAVADSLFYFFPIVLGVGAAKRFGVNDFIGLLLGAAMVYPSITGLAGKTITFCGLPMYIMDYTYSVFPIVLTVYVASKLEKVFKKIVPNWLAFFGVPMLTLVVTAVLAFFVIGPVMSTFSTGLANAVNAIYEFNPYVCAIVLGGPWVIIAMFGLNWAFVAILIVQMMNGGSAFGSLLIANCVAVAGAAIGVALKSKNTETKNLGISTGISAILGVTEPAIYGVLLPKKKPFALCIIAGSLASLPAAICNTITYNYGAPGVLGITNYLNPAGIDVGFLGAVLCNVLGFLFGLIFTLIFYKEDKEQEK